MKPTSLIPLYMSLPGRARTPSLSTAASDRVAGRRTLWLGGHRRLLPQWRRPWGETKLRDEAEGFGHSPPTPWPSSDLFPSPVRPSKSQFGHDSLPPLRTRTQGPSKQRQLVIQVSEAGGHCHPSTQQGSGYGGPHSLVDGEVEDFGRVPSVLADHFPRASIPEPHGPVQAAGVHHGRALLPQQLHNP